MRDRDGREIDVLTWGAPQEAPSYRVVAEARVRGATVRTVREGVDLHLGTMPATGVAVTPGSCVTVAEVGSEEQALRARQCAVEVVSRNCGPGSAARLRAALAADA